MNYRHIFHAGNICDVVKHAVLTLLIGHLRAKPAAFCILDTHAGIGLYDVRDARARQTGEMQDGALRFLEASLLPELSAYYGALKSFNENWQPGISNTKDAFRFYPGSPFLAARLLRPKDRLVACELHPEDIRILRRQAKPFEQMHIHHRDGYEALHAFLPPFEKRGLVLIDPPYEAVDEFPRLAQEIAAAHALWPQGMFMIWYPVKERPAIWRFHERMVATGIPRQLCAEFIYAEETRHDRLNGCGILLVNPPWQFDEKLRQLLPRLHDAMQTPVHTTNVTWLTEEKQAGGFT